MDKLKLFSLKPEPTTLDNGQTVHLRRITGAERLAWLDAMAKTGAETTLADALQHECQLLALTLCDEQGDRLFKDDETATVREHIDAVTIDRLAKEAMRLNRLGGEEDDAAAQKKSPTTSGDTSSLPNSPAPSA